MVAPADVKGESVNSPDDGNEEVTADPRFFHPVEEAKIVDWRTLCFLSMGFDEMQSQRLAVRRSVEHHQVAHMVDQGCDLKLAMKIVL